MNASAELDVTLLVDGDGQLPPGVLEALAGTGAAFYGLPAAEYHAVEAMSSGGARRIRKSPLHYHLMRTKASTPTAQMIFGTCVHEGVLEPDTFGERVICASDDAPQRPTSRQINAKKPSPETVEAIAWWKAFDAECAGKIVLSPADFDRCRRTIDAVHLHPAARHILDAPGENEVSLFWQDAEFKVPCKARLDRRVFGGIVDLKTAQDASREGFTTSIGAYDYHGQGAWYCDGHEAVFDGVSPDFFIFIVVESDEPFAVAVYELDRPSILAGGSLCREARRRYRAALDAGKWQGYSDKIETINAPRWALRDLY